MAEHAIPKREVRSLEPTDLELVRRARGGDHGSFHTLVDRHAQALFEMAAMMIGNTADAQDIVQETLLAAFEGLKRFEGRSAVRTWMIGILVRQVAAARRSRSLRKTASLDAMRDAAEEQGGASPHEPSVRSAEASTDARLDLMELMARLTDEHREVIVLRELVGLSYDEIAELLNVPRGTVESRLFRARQELKAAGPA